MIGLRRSKRLPGPFQRGRIAATARSVSFRYGDTWVLRDVDLDVRSGEVLALVGPNGAGKSTLLSVLAGDERATTGDITIDGASISTWSPEELALRRAVLPQQDMVAFAFLVDEVVRMGWVPWIDTDRHDDEEAVIERALQRADVLPLRWREVTSLSGGERARVALARVLAQGTGIVLLDEPTAALDLRHQELVMQIAREDAAAGAAVVVVLHDLALAGAYADRIALLTDGQLRALGTPRHVLEPELLSEVYGYHVEVIDHPRTGELLVLARRDGR